MISVCLSVRSKLLSQTLIRDRAHIESWEALLALYKIKS